MSSGDDRNVHKSLQGGTGEQSRVLASSTQCQAVGQTGVQDFPYNFWAEGGTGTIEGLRTALGISNPIWTGGLNTALGVILEQNGTTWYLKYLQPQPLCDDAFFHGQKVDEVGVQGEMDYMISKGPSQFKQLYDSSGHRITSLPWGRRKPVLIHPPTKPILHSEQVASTPCVGATPQHQTTLELVVINPLDAFFYISKRWTQAPIIQGIITSYGINKPSSKEVSPKRVVLSREVHSVEGKVKRPFPHD